MIREAFLAAVGRWSFLDWLTVCSWAAISTFVAAELVLLDRKGPVGTPHRSAEAGIAARMALGAILVGLVYGIVFGKLWDLMAAHAHPGLTGFWSRNSVLAAVAAFVAWDFSGWIYHLAGHRTRIGWAAHQAHHSGTEWNGSLALRLSWMPWHGLIHHPLLALAGFDRGLILGCLALSNVCQALQHSATLPPAPRWLSAVFVTPAAHRLHHGSAGAHTNLGQVLTIWDRLARTWAPGEPTPGEGIATGPPVRHIDPVAAPTGAVRLELAGWISLFRRVRRTDHRHDLELRTHDPRASQVPVG